MLSCAASSLATAALAQSPDLSRTHRPRGRRGRHSRCGDARASSKSSPPISKPRSTDQLVVVTLKSLQGTSIEDYGYQLGRKWQIGQKDKNNGVLLIVAPNERKVRIEVGYGLEGDADRRDLAAVIIQGSILPRFRAGDFAGGVTRGAEDIVQVLSGDARGIQGARAQRPRRRRRA